ncbi:MAG: N-acetyltransferase family protein [Spirochaetia bacterium]|nr:N-acetyltransferase family protein [Spirochaetia bacterium]
MTSSRFKVERVSIRDSRALLEIYAPYVKDTAISFEYEVPSESEFTERIEKISSRYPYLKAVNSQNEILGYTYAAPFKERDAYSWSVESTIYVRKDCRRNGTGTLLYNALEAELKKMGVLNVNACIAFAEKEDLHLKNDSMIFHEKMGFTLAGRFHQCGYKFNTWYDMIWMEKIIGEHLQNQTEVKFPSPDFN